MYFGAFFQERPVMSATYARLLMQFLANQTPRCLVENCGMAMMLKRYGKSRLWLIKDFVWIRGVTRLDGVWGKKQVWRPVFEPEVFRKQMYCIEESTCDIVETFRRPHKYSASGELCPLALPRYACGVDIV